MGGEGAACCCCITCMIILVIPITLISLSLKTHNPKIDVHDLFLPAIAGASNSTRHLNTFLFVELRLRNAMSLNGLRYEALNLAFFYAGNRSAAPVAEAAVPGFYQGVGKTARKTAVAATRGLPWEDAFDRISRGLTVDLAVELAMTVKLRRCGVYMRRKAVVVAAVVSLDGSGGEVDEKVVRMN